MKRFATALLCGLMLISVSAQTYTTTSSFEKITKTKKERTPLKFEFYGKAGLNIMSTKWNGLNPVRYNYVESVDSKPAVGFDLSFGFMSHFRPSNPSKFYWGAELSLSQIGGAFDEFSYRYGDWDYLSYSYIYDYPSTKISPVGVSIAPSIGWKKTIYKNISLDLHFNTGVFLTFHEPKVGYTTTRFYNKGVDSTYDSHDCFSIINSQYKIGAGVWFNRFNIDLSYRFATTYHYYDNSYSNVILSAGFKF